MSFSYPFLFPSPWLSFALFSSLPSSHLEALWDTSAGCYFSDPHGAKWCSLIFYLPYTHSDTLTNSIHNDTHEQSNINSSAQCSNCLSILPYFIVEFYFLAFVVLHIIKVQCCLLKLFLFMFCVLALVVSSSNNCLPKHVKSWVKAATHEFKSEPLNGLDTALYSPL